ncbi:MAG TPA: hypothetical protein VM889_06815 [Candidatus Thermoplasmatota archaeon]|nr:hypothetical protein [Candidatus Thermoplasmatota archaeon]
MRRAPAFALLLVLAPLAGCIGGPAAPPATDEGPAVVPERLTLWLTGGSRPGLSANAPTSEKPEEVAGGNFFAQWGEPGGYASFIGAPPGGNLLVVGNATVTFFAKANGPAVQAGVFPHFIAYLGTVGILNADGSAQGSAAMRPGDVVETKSDLKLPKGGLLLERDLALQVMLSVVLTQAGARGDGSDDVVFLVNSTRTPSRVEFDAILVPDLPAPGEPEAGKLDDRLAGSAYAGAREGASQKSHPLAIPPGTARVFVLLKRDQAAGFGDLDLAIVDANGTEVARGVTPFGVERVLLHPHQLGAGGAWKMVVSNYGSATSTYSLEWRVHPVAPAEA